MPLPIQLLLAFLLRLVQLIVLHALLLLLLNFALTLLLLAL